MPKKLKIYPHQIIELTAKAVIVDYQVNGSTYSGIPRIEARDIPNSYDFEVLLSSSDTKSIKFVVDYNMAKELIKKEENVGKHLICDNDFLKLVQKNLTDLEQLP